MTGVQTCALPIWDFERLQFRPRDFHVAAAFLARAFAALSLLREREPARNTRGIERAIGWSEFTKVERQVVEVGGGPDAGAHVEIVAVEHEADAVRDDEAADSRRMFERELEGCTAAGGRAQQMAAFDLEMIEQRAK